MYIKGDLDSNQKIAGSGLILNLDAAQKRSYSGSGTSWVDLSGNGYNGTLTNGPTFNSGNGGYFSFDGTNDYTTTLYTVPAQNSTTSFTWSCWVYPVRNNSNDIFMGNRNTILNFIKLHSVNFQYGISLQFGGNMPLNQWQNICVIKNQSNFSYYRNGVLIATGTSSDSYAANAFYIGGDAPAGEFAQGRVANVQIYNRAISATEVLNNFNATKSRFGFPNNAIVTDNLVLNLNAGNTNSYPTTGTTWFDLTSVYNGTLINGPTFNSGNGGSIVFDGTNDYVSTTSGIINITSNWSVVVWFKTTGSTNIASLVVRSNVGETLIWACYLQNSTGKVQFFMRNGTDQVVTGTTSTNNTGWHMATYTKDSSNVVRVYLDGVQENSATITNLSNIGYNVMLGRWGDSTGPYYYNGNIAMVLMYNTNLSDSQIKQNFDATKSTFGL